ncbi:MAG: guanylate cyclase [Leptospiraceae bacterium]|nr:guanylate cyclase [Leptospiraceae bacterium]
MFGINRNFGNLHGRCRDRSRPVPTISLFIILLLLSTLPLAAQEPIRITEPEGKIVLGLHTEYMEDKDGKLRFGDIRKMETDCKDAIRDNERKDAINRVSTTTEPCWNKSEQKNLNFGFTTSAYWIKFQIENEQEEYKHWLLEISYPFLDKIHLYSPDATGDYSLQITGDTFPFSNRKIPNRHFILQVPLHKEKAYTYYLRIESKGGGNTYPAILYSPLKMVEKEHSETIILGIFYGVLIALFLYNIFLFISLRDRSYFYYLSYLFSQTFFFLSANGLGQEYIWADWIWFNGKVFPISSTLVVISISLFISNYLSTKTNTPNLHKIIKGLIVLSILKVFLVFFIPYEISIKLIFSLAVSVGIIAIGVIFRTIFRVRAAMYFTVAWTVALMGIFLYAFRAIGFLPDNFLTNYSIQIGSALEMILLSIGLGDKINILKEEKLQTQKDAIEEQKKLITSYARFVPEQLLTFLGKDIITKVGLGDSVQKDMTILFSDIRSFTSISETLSPSENFGFINSYLETMGPIIRKHNGFIDKYIGDAIMALFPQKPSDAIDASIEMLEELYKLNVKRKAKGFAPISIGIGIHTGSQMLGIIGEKERMEGTVISDVVNTASRLEGLTKAYSTALLVSEDVLEGVADKSKYEYRFLDTVKVKGKNKAVRIFEILNGVSPRIRELKLQTKPDFESGIDLYYNKKFKDSLKKMKSVLKKDSKDKAAELYIERCNFYSKNGVDPNWDGVEKLDFK